MYDPSILTKGEVIRANPRRILIIQMRQIGDVVVATPAVRLLRRKFPKAHIAFLVEEHCAPIVRLNPHLDEVLVYTKEIRKSLVRQIAFIRSVRLMEFDLVLTFLSNMRTALIAWGAGARTRVAFPSILNCFFTTVVKKIKGYAALRRQRLLKALGIFEEELALECHYSEEASRRVESFLRQSGIREGNFLITLSIYSRKTTHCWPFPKYAQLIKRLAGEGRRFVFTEGPGEKTIVDPVVRETAGLAIKAPPLDLDGLTALFHGADLHIGVCSGPRHIAASQGTPTLTILGGTSMGSWTHPSSRHRAVRKGLQCQPCGSGRCDHIRCLVDLTVEEVACVVEEFIEQLKMDKREGLSILKNSINTSLMAPWDRNDPVEENVRRRKEDHTDGRKKDIEYSLFKPSAFYLFYSAPGLCTRGEC